MLQSALLPIENDRARVRPLAETDAAAYARGAADPLVRRFAHLPEPEYTEHSMRALVRGPVRDGLDRGDLAVLAIADPTSDAFAGSIVLFDIDRDSAEIGFWMHPEHRGRGMAGAAVALALELARRSGLTRVRARTDPENRASSRILTRAGFAAHETRREQAPSGQEVALTLFHRDLAPLDVLPLRTERLVLRLPEHADGDALRGFYGQRDVARFLLEGPWTAADAERQLRRRIPRTGLDDGREQLSLVVVHAGAVIGDVQLWLTDAEHRIGEIGWVLDPAFHGRGFASEAVRAVLDHGFAHAKLHRIAAQMDARNTASARLAERVGLRREAHLRQDWWSKGEWTDSLIYAALSTDPRPTG